MTAHVSVMWEHVHGCVALHYTSPISPSLVPGHSPVPRHKGGLMNLPSADKGEVGQLGGNAPGTGGVSPNTPRRQDRLRLRLPWQAPKTRQRTPHLWVLCEPVWTRALFFLNSVVNVVTSVCYLSTRYHLLSCWCQNVFKPFSFFLNNPVNVERHRKERFLSINVNWTRQAWFIYSISDNGCARKIDISKSIIHHHHRSTTSSPNEPNRAAHEKTQRIGWSISIPL